MAIYIKTPATALSPFGTSPALAKYFVCMERFPPFRPLEGKHCFRRLQSKIGTTFPGNLVGCARQMPLSRV
jgi:hypothetical protein